MILERIDFMPSEVFAQWNSFFFSIKFLKKKKGAYANHFYFISAFICVAFM